MLGNVWCNLTLAVILGKIEPNLLRRSLWPTHKTFRIKLGNTRLMFAGEQTSYIFSNISTMRRRNAHCIINKKGRLFQT